MAVHKKTREVSQRTGARRSVFTVKKEPLGTSARRKWDMNGTPKCNKKCRVRYAYRIVDEIDFSPANRILEIMI